MPEPADVTVPDSPPQLQAGPTRRGWDAARFSHAARILATILAFASMLLLSPPRGETFPGARPWGQFSLLRPLTDLLSLDGLLATERGVEIKDFAFHLAAAAALGLLAFRLARIGPGVPIRRSLAQPWLAAQILLIAWVCVSALSILWSGDQALTAGQAVLYGLALAWAISLAWTLEPQDVPALLAAIAGATTAGAVLCLWFYHERNPSHRPGFPMGNPNTLAAAIVPGILICISALAAAVENAFRNRRLSLRRSEIAAILALVPLIWCFLLADSRSATLGLAGGIVAMIWLRARRWLRWGVVGVALTLAIASALWLMQYSRLDAAMTRSATMRFRLYAWRYAAELWDQNWLTAIAGNGAGNYPRLAGQYSLRDRRFDPNAFMGDMVEHAHNELFEVLSEIGLVGGVTFVGGLLGTLVAAGVVLRRRAGDPLEWLYTGLLAALLALLIDACFSPGLRLPGVPVMFFTLLGILWALGRSTASTAGIRAAGEIAAEGASQVARPPRTLKRIMPAVAVMGLALAALCVSLVNWSGVLHEEAGREATRAGRFDEAFDHRSVAQTRVLDPVRKLTNDVRAGQALLGSALAATSELVDATQNPAPPDSPAASAPTTNPAAAAWHHRALERGSAAFDHAIRLGQRAPTILNAAALEAAAAELMSQLSAASDEALAAEWSRRAVQAWVEQRSYRPYDFHALLALTRYRWPLADHVRLLCDALRSGDAYSLAGQQLTFDEMRNAWRDALRRLLARDGAAEVISQFLIVVGPLDPQTDVDSLIASRAPEVYRVAAYAAAARGDFATAQQHAAQAVALYRPMRGRFPTLSSLALLEQAEFALQDSPANADHALELLTTAMDRLPVIQEQKYEALLQPYQRLQVLAYLAAGDEIAAEALLSPDDPAQAAGRLANAYVELARLYIRQPRQRRPDVEPWLARALMKQPDHLYAWSWRAWLAAEAGDTAGVDAILTAAGRIGVAAGQIAQIRNSLCQEFPVICDALRQ